MFTEHELKTVPIRGLKDAASTLEIARYGKKVDIAARIASQVGGEGILNKLVATSLKMSNNDRSKAPFFKKERARLVASGAKDDKKIEHVWIPGEGVVAKA